MEEPIICRVLTGPTASGKTGLGIRLAKEAGLEVLCMDSMQIYRRMDIGTAKPTREEMQGVPHHLMDICDPRESYSVSAYRDAAEKRITELYGKGKEVLLIGGTALYLQALMHPMGMGRIAANPALREELNQRALTPEGRAEVHRELEKLDPETAARLPVNDVRRVIRAIEVCRATGIPFSRQPEREEPPGRFRWRVVSTAMERTALYERINSRVTDMIRRGLRDEVASLLEEGVPEDAQSMQGLGYKEMIPCIHGKCGTEEAAEAIRTGTRHFAKRQMTFLRREAQIHYVNTESCGTYDEIRRCLLQGNENEQD